MLIPSTSAVLLITSLTTVAWLTATQSAAVTEVPPKSSRILNASFIQWKILQRYHPSRNLKHPTVVLKLNGESGSLVTHSSSTLAPFTVTTTKLKVHSVTAGPDLMVGSLADNLIVGRPQSITHKVEQASASSSSSSASSSSSSESKGDDHDDEYSDSEQSEEELTSQQSQYSIQSEQKPWAVEPKNSVGNPDYTVYDPHGSSSSEEDYHQHGGSVELKETGHDGGLTSTLPPHPVSAERRLDTVGPADFNGIVTEYAYKFGNSHELENLAVADDDQINRYFIKTKPKEVSFSVSPIIDYTATTPFAVTGGSSPAALAQDGHHEEEQSRNPHISTSSSSEIPSSPRLPAPPVGHFEFEQTTVKPEDGLGFKQYDLHQIQEVEAQPIYSSAIPATSTNLLPGVGEKQRFIPSQPVSDLELTGVTPAPSPTTTTDATSIPGIPGIDYPILHEIPYTGFDCQKQRYKGFFADVATKCQAWHYCDFTDGHSTFLCPNGTLFSQVLLTCDWWFNVDCSQAQQLYVLNERLYRYIKPPKPSFPEDFHGPQVDLWLAQQLQLGLLPKMKKKVKDKVVINN